MSAVGEKPASWWRRNFVRTYFVAVGLAVIPLTAFLFGAHNLLKRQAAKNIVQQSSRTGKMLASLVERTLGDSATFLQGFTERPDVLRSWERADQQELASTLARAHRLRPDFYAIGL